MAIEKKVTKKKVAKKTVIKKKTAKKAQKNRKIDKDDLWLTTEEALTVKLGISEQRRCDDKMIAEASKLELYVRDTNQQIIEKKALILRIEDDKKKLVKDYKIELANIKKRLGFSEEFGFNPETGQIILNANPTKPE